MIYAMLHSLHDKKEHDKYRHSTLCFQGYKGEPLSVSYAGFGCTECAVGEYNSDEGSDTCHPCSDTTAATETARSECRLCPMGTVRVNSSHCEDCLPGQYNDDQTITQDSCPECPYNHFSTESKSPFKLYATILILHFLYCTSCKLISNILIMH